ncbi:MAG: hypothetical protein LBG52_06235 [Candidatus Peribacteria bacterium]|nr:hypothetical protein [Candidatus Peribacteria bacterium]
MRNQAYCINNKVVGKEYFETYFRTYKLDNVTPMNFSYSYVENSENVENTYFIGDVKNGRNVLFS